MNRFRLLLVAATLAVAATGAWAPAASAAAYRYWTYWQGAPTGWTFATAGPISLVPADGAVEGWRFAVSTTAATASAQPRPAASFADICGSDPAPTGKKRVALVLDFGTAAEAPPGQTAPPPSVHCVVADADATGYAVLRAVVPVRAEASGLICGIDGYPTGECAPVVADPPSAAASAASSPQSSTAPPEPPSATTPEPTDPSTGTPWLLVPVAVVVGAVGAVFARRRRA